uniref:Uncharacterized protein n=2 Tax=Micrurus surinamensis TaxID=129470 RepID=A0A2D4NR46_MICSU
MSGTSSKRRQDTPNPTRGKTRTGQNLHTCTCENLRIHTHTHTHIQIHTHTHTHPSKQGRPPGPEGREAKIPKCLFSASSSRVEDKERSGRRGGGSFECRSHPQLRRVLVLRLSDFAASQKEHTLSLKKKKKCVEGGRKDRAMPPSFHRGLTLGERPSSFSHGKIKTTPK